jgi:hypothetical protein
VGESVVPWVRPGHHRTVGYRAGRSWARLSRALRRPTVGVPVAAVLLVGAALLVFI